MLSNDSNNNEKLIELQIDILFEPRMINERALKDEPTYNLSVKLLLISKLS